LVARILTKGEERGGPIKLTQAARNGKGKRRGLFFLGEKKRRNSFRSMPPKGGDRERGRRKVLQKVTPGQGQVWSERLGLPRGGARGERARQPFLCLAEHREWNQEERNGSAKRRGKKKNNCSACSTKGIAQLFGKKKEKIKEKGGSLPGVQGEKGKRRASISHSRRKLPRASEKRKVKKGRKKGLVSKGRGQGKGGGARHGC